MSKTETRIGKGNPAYSEEEARNFIKKLGVAKTVEIAEWFDVSDVAIRKRLAEIPGIESRKVRNRLVWFVPHDNDICPNCGSNYYISKEIPADDIVSCGDCGILFDIDIAGYQRSGESS